MMADRNMRVTPRPRAFITRSPVPSDAPLPPGTPRRRCTDVGGPPRRRCADDLSAARGVLLCALLGLGFWIAALYVMRLIGH